MAVADTARLIAALELQDKFSRPLANANKGLSGFEGRLKNTERVARGVSTGIGNALKIGLGAAAAGTAFLAVNIKAGVDSLNELEQQQAATNAALKSTKGISGQTADSIRDLAEKYESLNATLDDKVIQSGENLLLTFTNIRKEAFEPALEAALNMNEAMGGGPEGLQNTIIQVGKALNDPVRGATALRRVGVQLTSQQQEQIKTLVEQNDLYGAQQVILGELSTEFGGRFAAAGDTAAGKQALLRDRIEDVQKALAGPLLPAIDRVRDKLIDFLGSDRVLKGAETLGTAIANLFSDENLEKGVGLLERGIDALTGKGGKSPLDFSKISGPLSSIAEKIKGLPWEAIGNAAQLLGTGSKALLDAFLGMPEWVQTAVLTGWGLNKLTGGALSTIFSTLASGIIKGVLNMNAGVVNINAATVNGGGGGGLPTGGRGGGGFLGGLAGGLAVGAGVSLATTAGVMTVDFANRTRQQVDGLNSTLDKMPRRTAEELDASISKVDQAIEAANSDLIHSWVAQVGGINGRLEAERKELVSAKGYIARGAAAARDAIPWAQRNRDEVHRLNADEGRRFSNLGAKSEAQRRAIHDLNASEGTRAAVAHARLQSIRDIESTNSGKLTGILNKKWSTTVNLNVPVSVGINGTMLQRSIQRSIVLNGGASFGPVPT